MAGCPALMLCHIPDMDIHSAGYLRKIEMPISISDCILDIWQIPGRKLDILTNGYQKASLCITVYYSSLVEHEVVGKLLLVEEHRGGESHRADEESQPAILLIVYHITGVNIYSAFRSFFPQRTSPPPHSILINNTPENL